MTIKTLAVRADTRVSLILCIANLLMGCASVSSVTQSPKAVVQCLMPVPGHYSKYTTVSEIKEIEGQLSPELYATLLDWGEWLATANAKTALDDYDAQMTMPGNDNVFFGQVVVDGNPILSENTMGNTATVSLDTVLKDTDERSVLRKTKITFYLTRTGGTWRVQNVKRAELSFPDDGPFHYNLLEGLNRDIIRFKQLSN